MENDKKFKFGFFPNECKKLGFIALKMCENYRENI